MKVGDVVSVPSTEKRRVFGKVVEVAENGIKLKLQFDDGAEQFWDARVCEYVNTDLTMSPAEYENLTERSQIAEQLMSAAVAGALNTVSLGAMRSPAVRPLHAGKVSTQTVVGLFAYSLEEERSAQLDEVDEELDDLILAMLRYCRRVNA